MATNSSTAAPSLPPTPENVLPGAEPIFIDQGKTGLLFFHGYTGSPYEGRDFAYYFAQQGYGVWVPLLPGHGTRPEDLEPVSRTDWLDAADFYYQQMRQNYEKIVVCGQSMGGALALHIAAHHPVDAVVALAAAIFVKDWRLKFLPLARRVIRYYYKSKGPDISDKAAKTRSVSYPKYPLSSLIEFLKLIEAVKRELPRVTCPSLLIHSRKDHTITYENLAYIANHIASPVKHTLTLEKSYHVISVDQEKKIVFEKIHQFLQTEILP